MSLRWEGFNGTAGRQAYRYAHLPDGDRRSAACRRANYRPGLSDRALIGMLPAARVTDIAICVGPPDVIAQASTTVLIGGLQAARIGDLTAHGGVIVTGEPVVLIGPYAASQIGVQLPLQPRL
jgi:hypothetical protein